MQYYNQHDHHDHSNGNLSLLAVSVVFATDTLSIATMVSADRTQHQEISDLKRWQAEWGLTQHKSPSDEMSH